MNGSSEGTKGWTVLNYSLLSLFQVDMPKATYPMSGCDAFCLEGWRFLPESKKRVHAFTMSLKDEDARCVICANRPMDPRGEEECSGT